MVGSTALSIRLDPEDMRELVRAYQRCCADIITRVAGFVARYMGDGVLAYFGYPQAQEHDAERAVRAGLSLLEAVPKLKSAAGGPLQVRVGIATGLVVVGDLIGDGPAQEQAVVGETPNLAARLQALAEPGTVVISSSTRKLTGGLFDYRDLGTVTLKGFTETVPAWQVLSASASESRFEALRASTTTLIGREEELDLLLRRWAQTKAGEGRVIHITGEPGIGKSRLTQALVDCLLSDRHTRLQCHCSPYHTDSALHPVISHLLGAAGIEHNDEGEERLAKLEALLERSNSRLSETVPLLAPLLSIPLGDRYKPLDLSPQRRKDCTLAAVIDRIAGLAMQQPVLVVFEDAHWIDPTSLELLSFTIERVARLPVLLIITARPDFSPP